jgi:hypothetical protein
MFFCQLAKGDKYKAIFRYKNPANVVLMGIADKFLKKCKNI